MRHPRFSALTGMVLFLVFVQLPDHLGDERADLFQAPGACVAAHFDHHVLADWLIPPGARFGGADFLLTLAQMPGDLRQGLPLPLERLYSVQLFQVLLAIAGCPPPTSGGGNRPLAM